MKKLLVWLLFFLAKQGYTQVMTLYIADTKTACAAPIACLQVKEKPAEPYSLFYAPIEGFKYEAGYAYKLEVMKTQRADPQAETPYRYYLLRVVSKEKTPRYPAKFSQIPDQTILYLTGIRRNGKLEAVKEGNAPDIYFDQEAGKVSGNNSCNRYFGKLVMGKEVIKFNALASTRMACLNNKTETLFMQYLAEVNRCRVKGRVLNLLKDTEVLLQFLLPGK